MSEIALQMMNVDKSFGDVKVLKDVSFEVRMGEVHALLGQNGAGKSVLMKTLMGIHQPDSGNYAVGGRTIHFNSPAEAQNNRVSMVYQEFGLVKSLSVTENILLGRLPTRKGSVRWREARVKASQILDQLGSCISPDAIVGQLKVAEQQEVEIARALSYDPVVFIMDEPTAALSHSEIGHLYSLIDVLGKKGVAIVYITHKLNEVFDLADRVTVIRDGVIVGTHFTKDLNISSLVEKMTGKQIASDIIRADGYQPPASNILELKDFKAEGLFERVSLKVGKGEILGIAGLIGAGKTELAQAIFGALPKRRQLTGSMVFGGREVDIQSLTPNRSKKMGIGYVTEDRQAEGIIAGKSVIFNIILPAFRRVKKSFLLIGRLARQITNDAIAQVRLRPPDPYKLVSQLSGGNQQKVVIGKWLAAESKLLILDEPTRGVDVGAREEIYDVVRRQAKENGVGVLLLSSDEREIMRASDRILIMRLGSITQELLPNQTSVRQILDLILGEDQEDNAICEPDS